MKYRMVRFRVRASEVGAAEKAIIEFVGQVADEPGTLRYDAYKEADGQTFVHVMTFTGAQSEVDHRETAYAKAFVAKLRPLCEVEPEFTDIGKVAGSGR